MLVELEDGSIAFIDATGITHEFADGEALWNGAKKILADTGAPALKSGPANGSKASAREEKEKIEEAFGTLGQRLREVAEAEYGEPIVDAITTVMSSTTKKASGFLQKISRKKPGRRRYIKRRTA